MDKPELRTVARPGSDQSNGGAEQTKNQSGFSWRTITLLATPLVIGLVNLIDAHSDREIFFQTGQQKYQQLVGEGKEVERIAPEQGHSVGQKRRDSIIAEAASRSEGLVEGSRGIAHEKEEQGTAAAKTIVPQAQKTKALMRPQHDITENLLHITRLALLKHEGIEISIPSDFSQARYIGRNRRASNDAEMQQRVQMTGRLVENAAVAKEREDLSNIGKVPFQGCR